MYTPSHHPDFLASKKCAIGPLPPNRFSPVWQAAFGGPDAGLRFGCLSGDRLWDLDAAAWALPRSATAMADPQLRMAAEVAADALHDTGLLPARLVGGAASVGVFSAGGLPEHVARLAAGQGTALGKAALYGAYPCLLANTISSSFDFKGPSYTVDSACSSAISALHLAVESLLTGSCDAALVVATNSLVSPLFLRALAENGVLSATGRSLPFDADADGFVRGEGAVALVLVASADAPVAGVPRGVPAPAPAPPGARPPFRVPGLAREAVRVYATVLATGANHDGTKIQASEPSGAVQADLLRAGLRRAGVDPCEVALMEMHATGTPVGDPIESRAVGAVLGAGAGGAAGGPATPLLIGSVKGNFGHLEAAAGLVSLAKVALGLYYRSALPTIAAGGAGAFNPAIGLDALGLQVVTDVTPLAARPAAAGGRVLVGINSFGIGGSNAFALLAGADVAPYAVRGAPDAALVLPPPVLPALLIPIAATSVGAASASADAWAAFGADPASRLSAHLQAPPAGFEGATVEAAVRTHLASVSAGQPVRTSRSALVVGGEGPLHARLAAARPVAPVVPYVPLATGRPPRFGLVFAGQGALSVGAGDQQYAALPAFREAAHAFSGAYAAATRGAVTLLHPPGGAGAGGAAAAVPWHDAGPGGGPPTATPADVRLALPAAVMLQYATYRALAAVGLSVDAAAGHSAGEALAAAAAGLLSLAQLAAVTAARAAALAALPAGGGLVAVSGPPDGVAALLAGSNPHAAGLHVAAVNGAGQVTVGGPAAALDALLAALPGAPGVKATRLRVSGAFHGPDVEGVRPAFEAALAAAGWDEAAAPTAVGPGDGGSAFTSSTDGAGGGGAAIRLGAAHWFANMRRTVQWEAAAASLAGRVDLVVECSPRATLAPCWAGAGGSPAAPPILPAARTPGTALADTFTALAQAWCAGADLDWPALLGGGPVPGAPVLPLPWNHEVRAWVDSDTFGAPSVLNHSARGRSTIPLKLLGKVAHLNAKIPAPDAWDHLPSPDGAGAASAGGARTARAATARPTTPAATARPPPRPLHGSPPSPAGSAGTPAPPSPADAAAAAATAGTPAPPSPADAAAAAAAAAGTPAPPRPATVQMAISVTPAAAPGAGSAGGSLPATAVGAFPLPPYCADHVIAGAACAPGVSWTAWTAQLAIGAGLVGEPGAVLCVERLAVKRMLGAAPAVVGDGSPVAVRLEIGGADGAFAARATRGGGSALLSKPVATGAVRVLDAGGLPPESAALLTDLAARTAAVVGGRPPGGMVPVSARQFYRYLTRNTPLQHRPSYHLATDLLAREGEAYSRVLLRAAPPDGALAGDAGVLFPPALDACTHTGILAGPIPTDFFFSLPVSYGRMFVWPAAAAAAGGGHAHSYALMRPFKHDPAVDPHLTDTCVMDILVSTAAGAPAVLMEGLIMHQMREARPPPLMCTPVARVAGRVEEAAAAAAFPPGSAVWVVSPRGEGAAAAAFQLPAHRLGDGVLAPADVLGGPGHAGAQARLAAARVVVLVGCGVDPTTAAAALAAAPRAALVVALTPPWSLESARMVGWTRCAIVEHGRLRRVRLLTVPHVHQHGDRGTADACLAMAASADPAGQAHLAADGVTLMTERLQPGWTPTTPAPPPEAPAETAPAPGPRGWRLAFATPGQLGSLAPRSYALPPLRPGEFRLTVSASSLQFKDVMLAHGLLPGIAGELGMETVGTVFEVHPVTAAGHPHLAVGARVVALLTPPHGALASHATAHATLSCLAPPHWADADIVAAPTAWMTVLYALRDRGRLGAGETVLIHSAAGGVGSAAMAYAASLGCRIIASAGSEAKRAALAAAPGVVAVLDSRAATGWAAAVSDATGGLGVDVILNSLAGDLQAAGLALLAPGGRFVEIGKRDAVEGGSVPQAALLTNGSFVSAHIDLLSTTQPFTFGRLLAEVVAGMGDGTITPLPTTVLPMTARDAAAALRKMSRGLHTGKLVLAVPDPGAWAPPGLDGAPAFVSSPANLPPPPLPPVDAGHPPLPMDATGTVVVAGGTSGVGLIFAAEAMRCGARNVLILTSRPAAAMSVYSRSWIEMRAAAAGARLAFRTVDLTDLVDVARALTSVPTATPIQIVAHFANTYAADPAAAPLAADHPAWRVKVEGAVNLHLVIATMPTVKRFLLMSSMARVTGAHLQATYCGANDALRCLGAARVRAGLPATVVDLPAIATFGTLGRWSGLPEVLLMRSRGIDLVDYRVTGRAIMDVLGDGRPGGPAGGQAVTVLVASTMDDEMARAALFADAPQGGRPDELAPAVGVPDLPSLSQALRVMETALGGGPAATFGGRTAPAAAPAAAAAAAAGVVAPAPAVPPPPPVVAAPAVAPPAAVVAAPAVAPAPAVVSAPPVPPPPTAVPTTAAAGAAAVDTAAVRAATVAKLCELLDLAPDDIGDHVPLVSLGMDSLSAVELANWAADEYGTPPPSLAAAGAADAGRLEMLATMTLAKLVAAQAAAAAERGGAVGAAGAAPAGVTPAPVAAVPAPPAPVVVPAPAVPPPAAVVSAPAVAPPAAVVAAPAVAPAPAVVSAPPVPPPPTAVPTTAAAGAAAVDTAAVRAATVAKLCELLDLAPDDIGDHVPLVSLGMDSLSAVELANWAADEYGTPPPSLAAAGAADAGRLEMLATMTLAKLVAAQAAAAAERGGAVGAAGAAPAGVTPAPVAAVPAPPAPVVVPAPAVPPPAAVVSAPAVAPPAAVVAAPAVAPAPAVVSAPPVPPPPTAVPTTAAAGAAAVDTAAVRAATVAKLCELLDLAPDDIGDHVPLVSLGMDSLSAVELANWAADEYGTPPPSLAAAGAADAGRLEMLATMTLAKLVAAQAAAAAERGGAVGAAGAAPAGVTPAAGAACVDGPVPPAQPAPHAVPRYSITHEFDGATVFLTGATGFLGSVLLEQLLRCTDVAAVHVLVRGRPGSTAAARLEGLLSDTLFDPVRATRPGALAKVALVEGDVGTPGLAARAGGLDALAPAVDFILNCAARLVPHAHIRTAVATNAESVQRVAAFAAACPNLKAFVHVSTAYVAPMVAGTPPVKAEVLWPLPALPALPSGGDPPGGEPAHCGGVDAILAHLRDAPPPCAAAAGEAMMAAAGLTSEYLLSKLLAEHVVAEHASAAARLPAAIVRPSFIAPVAGPPLEGYFIGRSGGMALAGLTAVDLSDLLPAGVEEADVADARVAMVPADVVAAAVLAAAAATAVGSAHARAARRVGAQSAPGATAAAGAASPPPPPGPLPIFNVCSSGTPAPLTMGESRAIMDSLSRAAKATVRMTLSGGAGAAGLDGLAAGEYIRDFGRQITSADSLAAGLESVRALRFDCGGLLALEAGLTPAEHALFPLQWGARPGGGGGGRATVLDGRTWESTIKASQKYVTQLFKSR